MASYRYKLLGKERLPSMTEAEAIEHCTLTDEQLAAIPAVSRFDENGKPKMGRPPLDLRLGYALQLLFLGLTGRLASVTDSFPASVIKVVAKQIGVDAAAIASVKSIYRGKAGAKTEESIERRLREQRIWARDVLGFSAFDAATEKELASTLAIRARDAASQVELVTFAEEWLFERRVILPGVSALQGLAHTAFRAIETLALDIITAAIKPARLRGILKLMFEPGPSHDITVLEWLKGMAGKHGVQNLEIVSARVAYLRRLGADQWNLSSLSQSRIQAFAQRVSRRPPSETSRRALETQVVEVICFLQATLWELTDETIFRLSLRTKDLVRMATKKLEKKQANRSGIYRTSVESIVGIAEDKSRTLEDRVSAIIKLGKETLSLSRVCAASLNS